MAHCAASAPWPPATFIAARQPFIDQFFAQTFAAARQDAEFAAIDILVAAMLSRLNGPALTSACNLCVAVAPNAAS
jgi:hypothetical protein